MPKLNVYLLGPVSLQLDEKSLRPLRSVKAEALLFYLLTERARNGRYSFPREQVMALLWPEMPDASARQNLRQTLYLVRQAIPHVTGTGGAVVPLLLSDRQTVQLNPEATYELDVARFLQLRDDGTGAALAQAIDNYRGPFLTDFYLEDSNEFETWAAAHRADLQRIAEEILAKLVEQAWEQGAVTVERVARRWIALNDLAEPPHRALVQALARQGRRAEAARLYQRYAAQLEDALGVEPAVALAQLLADEPVRSMVPSPRLSPIAPLPAYLTPFIGREQEVAQLEAYLTRPEVRLITIVGPGGAGKTRLAVEVIRGSERDFAGGIFFIPLADLEDRAELATALAGTLGISLRDQISVREQLLAYLRPRRSLLLLDSFERLLPAGDLLPEILREAPDVRFLVTSHERLNVAGEWLLTLGGLPVTPAAGETVPGPAVRLLVQSAQRVRSDFTLTAENQPHLVRICHLLQGMPLGLELAAFWLRHLDSATLAAEIERNVDFLASTFQNLPARHRSLRAIFDYTWTRLDEGERGLLRMLSVFQGGFTLPAARQVAGASLGMLAALADKSLLQPPATGAGQRYRIHAHLRRFIVEQLAERAENAQIARARHAEFFARWLARQERGLQGIQLPGALATVTAEIENVRAAWRWVVGAEGAPPAERLIEQMVQPMLLFYEVRGWFQEGDAQFRLAAEQTLSSPVRALVLAVWGWFSFRRGAYEQAYGLLEESVALTEDPRVQMFALSSQALVHTAHGHFDQAEEKGQASLEIGQGLEAQVFKAFALHNLGSVARVQEAYEAASRRYEESRMLFQAVGNGYGAAFALINLGNVKMQLGDRGAAEAAYREGLALSERAGYRYGESVALRNLALAILARGESDSALRMAQDSLDLAKAMADTEGTAWARMALAQIAARNGRIPLALQHYGQAQTIFQTLGHGLGQARAAVELAEIALARGDYSRTARLAGESLELYRRLGQRAGQAVAHSLLARLAATNGRDDEAEEHLHQAQELVTDLKAEAALAAVSLAETVVGEKTGAG